MINILLFGKNGQLGWELHRTLSPLGRLVALDFPDIDLKHEEDLRKVVLEVQPKIIVNAAAYTAVDQAEKEPETAMAINGRAPGILAELAKRIGAALIHYSTDYVFDGTKESPYLETDDPNPLNIYGKSKLFGEQTISEINPVYLILRTSWVYSLRRDSFVTKVLSMSRSQEIFHIVTDQTGSPTWSRMLAETTTLLLAMSYTSHDFIGWLKERRGLYHLAGSGSASRFEWAKAILNYYHHDKTIKAQHLYPATTVEFPTPAKRPQFSALDCSRFEDTFDLCIPPWRDSLNLAIESA